jgi:hypothetical protein
MTPVGRVVAKRILLRKLAELGDAALFGFRATTVRDRLARTVACYRARESSYNLVAPHPALMTPQPQPSAVRS